MPPRGKTVKARKAFDPDAWEAAQHREVRAKESALHPVLEYLPDLEEALQAKGFPAMSPWWRSTFERFYSSPCRRLVLRVGRRGGKSSSLCRIAVLEALHGDHDVPPGDVGVVAVVSVDRTEAVRRITTIRAILDAIGVEYTEADRTIRLKARPIAFQVFTGSISGVSGFTSIFVLCDEVAKWRDADTGANPATEVLASIRPTMASQRNARMVMSSSPMGVLDAHAKAFDEGDSPAQQVASAPTWVAHPALTEEQTHLDEPDERTWLREYKAVPQEDAESAILNPVLLDRAERKGGPAELLPARGWSYVAAIDPATRSNAWTLVVITRGYDGVRMVVLVREWRGTPSKPLDPRAVLLEMAGILRPYAVKHVETDQWSGDALAAVARDPAIALTLVIRSLTSGDKVDLWKDLRTLFSDGKMQTPVHPQLRADLLGVRERIAANGLSIRYAETPDGRHSDYAPSFALAASAHCAPPRELPQEGSPEQAEADALTRDLKRYAPKKKKAWWKADPTAGG